MRSSKLFLTVATLVVALCAVSTTQAQVTIDKNRSYFSPDQQFGFGVNNAGMHIQYALGPAFHLGLNLNLDFTSGESASETSYDFGPYAKFLFSGDVIKPYAYAALGVVQRNSGKFEVLKNGGSGEGFDANVDLPDTEIRTYLAFGGEHYFNQNVGVYGHVNLLNAKFSPEPSVIEAGLRGGVVGVEFFF